MLLGGFSCAPRGIVFALCAVSAGWFVMGERRGLVDVFSVSRVVGGRGGAV